MKRYLGSQTIIAVIIFMVLSSTALQAQDVADTTFIKPGGKLWGLAYGDYAYKMRSDSLNRGGLNQYTGIKQNESLFQLRRIYLGYDYRINKTFSGEFLLATEDNMETTVTGTPVTSGNLLSDGKLGMFIKLANVKWHNIIPGADLSIGEVYTPAAVLLSEVVWDYRCIERTVSEVRRTPAWDMGASLNGKLYNSKQAEVGYNLMVGNGTGSRPENNGFKMFYGDVYTKLWDKKIILDLYADYTKINWTPSWHHDRSMVKGLVAYTTPKLTVGVEAFMMSVMNDNIATETPTLADTITTKATAVSVFARGRIYKDQLGFFVRYDNYDPSGNNQNSRYTKYSPLTRTYDPNTAEQFFTAGIDYSPISKIHIMPNVWYNAYNNAGPLNLYNSYDLVFRLSIYYVYGK